MTMSFKLFLIWQVLYFQICIIGCSSEDQFITDNNVCPTSVNQEVEDTTDFTDILPLDITGLSNSYGQIFSYDNTKSYWGIRLRLRTNLTSSDNITIKIFENDQKVITARIPAKEVTNTYGWHLARFNNIRSFTGSTYFSITSDRQTLQDMNWSSGSGSGLLELDSTTGTWSEISNQRGHYRLLPCL